MQHVQQEQRRCIYQYRLSKCRTVTLSLQVYTAMYIHFMVWYCYHPELISGLVRYMTVSYSLFGMWLSYIPDRYLVIQRTQLCDIHLMVCGCISSIRICRVHMFDIHCLASDYLGLSSSVCYWVIQHMQMWYKSLTVAVYLFFDLFGPVHLLRHPLLLHPFPLLHRRFPREAPLREWCLHMVPARCSTGDAAVSCQPQSCLARHVGCTMCNQDSRHTRCNTLKRSQR